MQGYLHFSFLIFLGKKKEKKFSLLQCHGKTWKCKPAVGSRHSGSCNGKKAGMVYQQNMKHILNIRLPK